MKVPGAKAQADAVRRSFSQAKEFDAKARAEANKSSFQMATCLSRG
jgi:hypothetical protein